VGQAGERGLLLGAGAGAECGHHHQLIPLGEAGERAQIRQLGEAGAKHCEGVHRA
jgi:hypothetical protein